MDRYDRIQDKLRQTREQILRESPRMAEPCFAAALANSVIQKNGMLLIHPIRAIPMLRARGYSDAEVAEKLYLTIDELRKYTWK